LTISSDEMAKPAQAPLNNSGDPARAFVRREPNQKRRMHAGPLIGKEKDPWGCRLKDSQRVFALQLDITDLGTFGCRLSPERCLALLEGNGASLF